MPAGKNVCDCPLPPGGRAVCSEEQLAICRVIDGVAHTECIDLGSCYSPREMRNAMNVAVMRITRQRASLGRGHPLSNEWLLARGKYVSTKAGTVTFRLPKKISLYLQIRHMNKSPLTRRSKRLAFASRRRKMSRRA